MSLKCKQMHTFGSLSLVALDHSHFVFYGQNPTATGNMLASPLSVVMCM